MRDIIPQELYSLSPFYLYLFALVASCYISMYAVRKIIFISNHRKIYDIPDDIRKFHGDKIPSLGGIGIFIGFIVIACFFMFVGSTRGWNYIIASAVILFFTGIYDDLMNMRPSKKLLAQLLASFITIFFSGTRLLSFEGIFGIGELPYWLSIGFTTVFCTFFINVFNFIDGIDGLACVIAIFYSILTGIIFATMAHIGLACIAFSLAGATAGLFYYNVAPAKIYMGDTGSMLLGFCIFVFTLQEIDCYKTAGALHNSNGIFNFLPHIQGFLTFLFSILFLPVFDAFRVFVIRIAKGVSPLKADRSHLHYYLLDAGFTHTQSVIVLLVINIVIIFLAYFMQNIDPIVTVVCITALSLLMVSIIYRLRKKNLLQTRIYNRARLNIEKV